VRDPWHRFRRTASSLARFLVANRFDFIATRDREALRRQAARKTACYVKKYESP
jgi:hypothetical protein